MDSEAGKSRWVKLAPVVFAMLAIFQTETFFPGMESRQTFIRTAIEVLAFVPFAFAYRKQLRSKTWTAFLLSLACGLFALNLLVLFVFHHKTTTDALSRFMDWSGDWFPAFAVLPFAIYSISKTIIKEHRSPKG
ncbi:MAG: hypothetical protein WAN33_00350 [Candidatus Acidiferrales bacterium]